MSQNERILGGLGAPRDLIRHAGPDGSSSRVLSGIHAPVFRLGTDEGGHGIVVGDGGILILIDMDGSIAWLLGLLNFLPRFNLLLHDG